MRVNFMIIGAQKCGTTTLFNILNNHPSIVGCSRKEPHFFSTSSDWKSEIIRYHKLFKKTEDVLYFEASTSYTFYPLRNLHIWDDIFAYNPNMKFVYVVRSPLDRIVSSYMHRYQRGFTNLNIQEAIIKERLYIELTRYYTQIIPFIRTFGRNNVLIIDFENLIQQKGAVVKKISEFLSIDVKRFRNISQEHSNVSIGGHKMHHKFDSLSVPVKRIRKHFPSLWNKIMANSKRGFSERPVLSREFKEMIINMLELEIVELQKLMKKDLGKWMLVKN